MAYLTEDYPKQEIRNGLIGLASFNQEITFFDFGCVVVQKNYLENENVRIVSGGRYFNPDFVGEGMLTCCIQGEQRMAPPSKIILRTLRELSYNHSKGILLLVSSSTGNLLNFGVAIERAKNDNLRVRIIQVNDADDDDSLIRLNEKGLTGIVLLSKIAGAMSEQGKSLTDIYTLCNDIVTNIVSVGINSMSQDKQNICTLCKRNMCREPTEKTNSLHVDENACLFAVENIINVIPDDTFAQEKGKLNLKTDDCVVVLINHNGSMKKLELFNFIKELIQFMTASLIHVKRVYLGNFVCSHDVTITIMKVENQEVIFYLDAPCSASGWQKVNQGEYDISIEDPIKGRLLRKERLSPPIRGPKLRTKVANVLLYATQFACDALISCEKQLNTIDSERGNGDTGSKLKFVSEVLLKRMNKNKIISYCPFTFFESLSKTLETAVGGTTGCIYSILFEAAAASFDQYQENMEITPFMWLGAFESAAAALHKYGNVRFGDGTMYDPIFSCIRVAKADLEAGNTFIDAFGKGVEAAEYSATLTRKEYKYPDSGAHAVGIWMRAILEGIKLMYSP